MTVAHTTVLKLLGKQVSFICSTKIGSDVYSSHHCGTVTSIVFNLTGEPQISVDDGDYYSFSDLIEFEDL